MCDAKRRALLCHITKFNNVQEDVDDLMQIGFLMRHVWSSLGGVWHQERHFPTIMIDLVDCCGSSATISIRWAEEVPGNMHKFLRDLIQNKSLESFGPKKFPDK